VYVCAYCTSAKYFTMSRKQCKESLELYKKFVVRMELVARFLAVAEVSCGYKITTTFVN